MRQKLWVQIFNNATNVLNDLAKSGMLLGDRYRRSIFIWQRSADELPESHPVSVKGVGHELFYPTRHRNSSSSIVV